MCVTWLLSSSPLGAVIAGRLLLRANKERMLQLENPHSPLCLYVNWQRDSLNDGLKLQSWQRSPDLRVISILHVDKNLDTWCSRDRTALFSFAFSRLPFLVFLCLPPSSPFPFPLKTFSETCPVTCSGWSQSQPFLAWRCGSAQVEAKRHCLRPQIRQCKAAPPTQTSLLYLHFSFSSSYWKPFGLGRHNGSAVGHVWELRVCDIIIYIYIHRYM